MAGRPAVEGLLRAALAHVPSKGFTLDSIKAAIPATAEWKSSNVDRALSVMFPGPDGASTSAPRRLFQTWDHQVTEELNENYSNNTEITSDDRAVQWLCDRLMKSQAVKPHLLLVSDYAINLSALDPSCQRAAFEHIHVPQHATIFHGCTEFRSIDDACRAYCRRSMFCD